MSDVFPVSLCIQGILSIYPDGKHSFKAMLLGIERYIYGSHSRHSLHAALPSLLLNTVRALILRFIRSKHCYPNKVQATKPRKEDIK